MDTNVETVCATATQILLRVLRGERPASRVVISTELVLRDSFRPDLINKNHASTHLAVENDAEGMDEYDDRIGCKAVPHLP